VEKINVIGAGLAGSEAAWQIAQCGLPVRLYEMRPLKRSPAHHSDNFAELVCSNSLRSNLLTNAVGLLKEEMRAFNSLIIKNADFFSLPAGGALAVDREKYSQAITERIKNHPLIEVVHQEVTSIPKDSITIIATGPLTSDEMAKQIQELLGEDYLYFYDAAAPIITKDSIDFTKVFYASRYEKGEAAYINCPMNKEEFNKFYQALVSGERSKVKDYEKEIFFEGCMPIEEMADRGEKTILFGPLKPVGLIDPRTKMKPYAVVQLRQDNQEGTLYNIVGFQTHLKWGEQKKVISLIPGLENAEIVRYGVMHRNTYINSPRVLLPTYQYRKNNKIFFAGQITGVEGYVESAASGLVAGINAALLYKNIDPVIFPKETVIGSMANYITTANQKYFQPMNANFGLLPELPIKYRDKSEKNSMLKNRSLETIQNFIQKIYNSSCNA